MAEVYPRLVSSRLDRRVFDCGACQLAQGREAIDSGIVAVCIGAEPTKVNDIMRKFCVLGLVEHAGGALQGAEWGGTSTAKQFIPGGDNPIPLMPVLNPECKMLPAQGALGQAAVENSSVPLKKA